MLLIILAAVFLGSFALLFSVWLITWSFIMRPISETTLATSLEYTSVQDLSYDLSGNEAIPSLRA
jgi:uncharacterized membrane protein